MRKILSIGTLLLLSLLLIPNKVLAVNITGTTCPGNGCVDYNVSNQASVGIQITGTWTGTFTFQSSVDNVTFTSILVFPSSSSTPVTTTTSNGVWQVSVSGIKTFRVRVTSGMFTGTAVITPQLTNLSLRRGTTGGGGGSGTVTQIDTSSPITGGPITDAGSIECPTCGVTSSPLSQFASTTSAQLAGVISNETGTGVLVFNTSPTFVTPTLGAASATTLDTGQGANELFDMDQNVLTTSDVIFNLVSFLSGDGLSFAGGGMTNSTIVGGDLGSKTAIVIDNTQEGGWNRISLPSYTDFIAPNGFWIQDLESSPVVQFGFDTNGLYVTDGIGLFTVTGGTTLAEVPVTPGAMSDPLTSLTGQAYVTPSANMPQSSTGQIYGVQGRVIGLGSNNISEMIGTTGHVANGNTGTTFAAYGNLSQIYNTSTGTITSTYGYSTDIQNGGGGTITKAYAFYSHAMGGLATAPYSFWSDEQGVFRIRADNTYNSVYQAIPALYNPQFTKYVPDATDYERCIPACQWESNVAVITNEAAGTGTMRVLQIGKTSVPTRIMGVEQADPSAPAANNAVIYFRDNGSGKTQACARFATGAVQCFATEP